MFATNTRHQRYHHVASKPGSSRYLHDIKLRKAESSRGMESHGPGRPRAHYAPALTRWPIMTLIILALLSGIGILEYGLRNGTSLAEKTDDQTQARLFRRQDSETLTALAATSIPSSDSIVVTSSTSVESQSTAAIITIISTSPTTTPDEPTTATTTATSVNYVDDTPAPTPTTPTTTTTTTPSTTTPQPTTTVGATAYQTLAASPTRSTTTTPSTTIPQPTTTVGATAYQTLTSPQTSTTASALYTLSAGSTSYINQSPSPNPTADGVSSVISAGSTSYIAKSSTTAMKGTTSPIATGTFHQASTASAVYNTQSKPSYASTAVNPSRGSSDLSLTDSVASLVVSTLTFTDATGGISTSLSSSTAYYAASATIVVNTLTSTDSTGAILTSISSSTSYYPLSATIVAGTFTLTDSTGRVFTSIASSTSYYQVSATTVVSTMTFTDPNGALSTSVTSWVSYYPGGATESGASASLPSTPPDEQKPYEVELGLAITGIQHFNAMYLPILIAVLLKLIWTGVFAATKLMEPFYLLQREGGASAKDALMSDYLSPSISMDSLKALFIGHPVVLLASLAYLFISILPALTTQSTIVRATAWCGTATTPLRCNPTWYLNITIARVLQGVLAATAVIVFTMMALSARRKSGVFSNPSSIATMASLLSNDEIIYELQGIPQGASSKVARRYLDNQNYTLTHYQTRSGRVRYGFAKTVGTVPTTGTRGYGQQRYSAVPNPSKYRRSHNAPLVSRSTFSNKFLLDTVFLLSILALLAVLVGYYLTGGNNAFNNFFNSNKMSRFVLTLTASILDGNWKQLEREVRILTPYRRLCRGSASPESTVLVTLNGTPVTCFFPALLRGNFFHAYVAFVATLSDVLIITIAGVPYSSSQTWMDFVVSIYTSWAILSIMTITVLAIFRWRALNEKMMIPKEPSTLLAVWLLLCNDNNGLREATQGYEMSSSKERDEWMTTSSELYWAGWQMLNQETQPPGGHRWCVEREDI